MGWYYYIKPQKTILIHGAPVKIPFLHRGQVSIPCYLSTQKYPLFIITSVVNWKCSGNCCLRKYNRWLFKLFGFLYSKSFLWYFLLEVFILYLIGMVILVPHCAVRGRHSKCSEQCSYLSNISDCLLVCLPACTNVEVNN